MKRQAIRSLRIISLLLVLAAGIAACKGPGSQSADFAAYYTSYGSPDDISGPFADVLVRFPDGKMLVFSRESSYLPFLEYGDDRWSLEEIIPRHGDGEHVRPDQHNIYSYVRIIQNNENEVLIHWRYVPDFAQPGFSGVVHEYYTIRPDGSVHTGWQGESL